jgi:hypothetical protein
MQQNNETENLQLTSSSAPNDRTPPDPTTPASLPPQAFNPVVLEVQHAQAVREIEDQRAQHGQLTTGINAEVGASILTAGKLSLAKSNTGERETGPSTQFVVAAPPGTGKTSHAIALMIAVVRIAERRRYANCAKQLILEIMPVGACGLVVCPKPLVDH